MKHVLLVILTLTVFTPLSVQAGCGTDDECNDPDITDIDNGGTVGTNDGDQLDTEQGGNVGTNQG